MTTTLLPAIDFITCILSLNLQSSKLNLGGYCAGWPNGLASSLALKHTSHRAGISCISLADNRLMDVTQLALNWVGWPNGEKLASKFDLDQSERKSTQVVARPGQTESQVDVS